MLCLLPLTPHYNKVTIATSDIWQAINLISHCTIVVSRVQCRMKLRYLAIWGVAVENVMGWILENVFGKISPEGFELAENFRYLKIGGPLKLYFKKS